MQQFSTLMAVTLSSVGAANAAAVRGAGPAVASTEGSGATEASEDPTKTSAIFDAASPPPAVESTEVNLDLKNT